MECILTMLSPAEAAQRKNVSVKSIRDILRNEERRKLIFPGAHKIGSKRGGLWMIPEDEVNNWQPRNYPRNA